MGGWGCFFEIYLFWFGEVVFGFLLLLLGLLCAFFVYLFCGLFVGVFFFSVWIQLQDFQTAERVQITAQTIQPAVKFQKHALHNHKCQPVWN